MRRPRALAAPPAALALALATCSPPAPPPASAAGPGACAAPDRFAYDPRAPLDVQIAREGEREGGVRVADLTFASPRGGRVTAFLVEPPASFAGRRAALLFAHWGNAGVGRDEFLGEAVALAREGAASALIDAPFTRPPPWHRPIATGQDADVMAQTVVDQRRALDLLLSRPGVDPARVGFVGHSHGAQVGALLTQAEPRIKAFVLMAGLASFTEFLRSSPVPGIEAVRRETPEARFAAFLAAMEPLDAHRFVARPRAGGAPLFFQFARDDYLPHADAARYLAAAAEPKLARFYEGGHELGERARVDRDEWLAARLGLAHPPAPSPRVVDPGGGLADLPGGQATALRTVGEAPGMAGVRVVRDVAYGRGPGGGELRLDAYLPRLTERHRKIPGVVVVHGQAPPALLARVREWESLASHARLLAASGLVVFVPALGSAATGPEPARRFAGVAEVAANLDRAVAFVRERAADFALDPDRLCLEAQSAGGAYGLRAALRGAPPYVRCVVASNAFLTDAYLGPAAAGGEFDPGRWLREGGPPALVVRSGYDFPELLASVDAFVGRARAARAPVEVIDLPKAHHAFEFVDEGAESRAALARIVSFIDENVSR